MTLKQTDIRRIRPEWIYSFLKQVYIQIVTDGIVTDKQGNDSIKNNNNIVAITLRGAAILRPMILLASMWCFRFENYRTTILIQINDFRYVDNGTVGQCIHRRFDVAQIWYDRHFLRMATCFKYILPTMPMWEWLAFRWDIRVQTNICKPLFLLIFVNFQKALN